MPAELLATIRFCGIASEREELAHEAELRRWLAQPPGYEAEGSHRFAGYDPPFTIPFMRRNEVMIPLRAVAPAPAKAGSPKP